MTPTPLPTRLTAFALSAAIVVTLFATIVGHMPPGTGSAPTDARNGAEAPRIEVAIVPSRIEVVGVRRAITAADETAPSRPRS